MTKIQNVLNILVLNIRTVFRISNFGIRISPRAFRGFTLIELLVVMMIIGLLATLGVVNYMDARSRARDAQRKANLQQIQSALELYRADEAAYPNALLPCGNNPLRNPAATVTYLQKIPCDPGTAASYGYSLTGATYTLRACLENMNDPLADVTNVTPDCNGTSNRSYTLTNP